MGQRIAPIIAATTAPKTGKRLYEGLYNKNGIPICIGGQVMDYMGTEEDGSHRFRCPAGGCHLKDKMGCSRYCDFDFAEKTKGKLLRKMGPVPPGKSRMETPVQVAPHSGAMVQQRQAFEAAGPAPVPGTGQGKPAARMSMLGYLLTA